MITPNPPLSTIVGYWRSMRRSEEVTQLQWILDEMLQLLRLEEAGQGRWIYRETSVPTMKEGDVVSIPEGANRTS